MRKFLLGVAAALLLSSTFAFGQIVDRPTGGQIQSGTAFPASPATGDLFIITDDTVAGACNSGGGAAQTLCRWSGAAWLPLGDGQAAGGTVALADIDTSAELRAILTDETGTGALVFAGGALGAATATTINGAAITATTGGTLTLANSSTLATSGANSITLTSTTPTNVTLPTTGTLATTAGNVATATALAANPADCAANNFATTIAANGDLTCAQPSISAGVSGLGANVATFLGTATSANLASAVSNETGSGALVFGTAPTLDSPIVTTKMNFPTVAAFPGTPSSGDIVIVTDDSAAGACDSAAGSARSLCQYNGASWVSVGDGTAGGGGTAVTSTSTFVTDNLLIRSDGTSRGVQNSGITIGDTNNVSGINDLAVGGNATITGTVTASNLAPLSGALTSGGVIWTDGTNIASSAMLANNGLVIGGGTGFTPETVAGLTSDGASQVRLGVAGASVGSVQLANITSGTITVQPVTGALGTVTISLPATTGTMALTSGNVATATALAADPADCSANNYATAIAASGALTCGQVSLTAGVTGTLPVGNGGTGITALGTGVGTALGQNVTGTGGIALATAPTISALVASTKINLPRVTAFPGTPAAGDTVIVTDDSTAGACDSAAGAATSLCQYDGAAWVKLGDGTSAGGALSSTDIDTSAELRTILTDETGTGALVFAGGDIGAAVATTPAANDNDTSVATTAYVQTELTAYASDTATFTNKTIDAEGTGNVITLPLYKDFPAAGCNNATATSFWDLPTTSPAVPACRTGTNTQKGTLDFADGANLTAQSFFRLPTGWTGNIDAVVTWISTTTTGDVVWQIAIACASDGDADDPAFTDDAFTADTAKGTANLLNDTASNTVTTTGTCAAGDIAHIRIRRDSAHASDSMAGTARLVNLQLTYRIAH